jgi:hypothetical protein
VDQARGPRRRVLEVRCTEEMGTTGKGKKQRDNLSQISRAQVHPVLHLRIAISKEEERQAVCCLSFFFLSACRLLRFFFFPHEEIEVLVLRQNETW